MRTNKAFTLAEIMIVLAVIGILTAILLPAAFHAAPDENLMKLKKTFNAVGASIRELAYHHNGDLGKMPSNGALITSATYFCSSLADVLAVKSVNCSSADTSYNYETSEGSNLKANVDAYCQQAAPSVGDEIITNDRVSIFQADPASAFGVYNTGTTRLYGNTYKDSNGFDRIYKILCIDVDLRGSGATTSNCVNECPFGFGVRSDGKIITGARLDTWLAKGIQEN